MTKNLSKLTNKELVELIGGMTIGSPSIVKAQHIQAEIIRRLIESIDSLNKSTALLSCIIIALTFIMLIIAIASFFK